MSADCHLDEAKAQLEAVGIICIGCGRSESWTAPGYVDAQSITEGTELHKGEEVVLSVSKGQTGLDSSKEAEIPELAGHPYQEAKELAGTSGFYIYQAERVYDDEHSERTGNRPDTAGGRTGQSRDCNRSNGKHGKRNGADAGCSV